MAKIHDIMFQIKSNLSSSVAKTFSTVNELTRATATSLDTLGKKNPFAKLDSSNLTKQLEILKTKNDYLNSSFSKSQSRADKLRNQYNDAQRKCKDLAREMNTCGVVSQKQAHDFERAIQKSDALKLSWRNASNESKNLKRQIKEQSSELEQLNKIKLISDNKNRILELKKHAQDKANQNLLNAHNAITVAKNAVASVDFFAEPIKQAMKFESVMADIRKLVHFDTPQEFAEMGNQLKILSTRVPMAVDGLGHIAAAAAQAGIAKNEIIQFTENAAQMGVAYSISAEQAGDMMAKWRSAFSLNQDQAVKLADQINILSDNSAATGVEIGEVVSRIGALGKIAGVSQADIAALAATSIGAGVQTEVAATGIKKMMTALTSGSAMTKNQVGALDKLGINVVTLSKDISSRGVPAILDLLDKIKQLPQYEQSATLKQIFGEESIAPIAGIMYNLDKVRVNLGLVGDSTKYAGSMMKEFNARSATTENSLQLFKNNIAAVAITMGNVFLPILNELMTNVNLYIKDIIIPFVDKHGAIIKVIGGVMIALAGLVASLAIVKAVFSSLTAVWIFGSSVLSILGRTILWLNPIQIAMATATKLMVFWQKILNFVVAVNPLVRLVMILVAVGSAIYWVCTHWEEFLSWINKVWEKIKDLFGWLIKVKDTIASLFDNGDGKKTLEIDAEIKNSKKFSGQLEANMTGANKSAVSQNMTVNSSPTVIIQGNATADDIHNGITKANQQQQVDLNKLYSQQLRFSN